MICATYNGLYNNGGVGSWTSVGIQESPTKSELCSNKRLMVEANTAVMTVRIIETWKLQSCHLRPQR